MYLVFAETTFSWVSPLFLVMRSLILTDFTFNRFMMKLFGTTDMNIIEDCQAYFGTQPPSEILTKRRCKFLERNSFNCLCRYCCV